MERYWIEDLLLNASTEDIKAMESIIAKTIYDQGTDKNLKETIQKKENLNRKGREEIMDLDRI